MFVLYLPLQARRAQRTIIEVIQVKRLTHTEKRKKKKETKRREKKKGRSEIEVS